MVEENANVISPSNIAVETKNNKTQQLLIGVIGLLGIIVIILSILLFKNNSSIDNPPITPTPTPEHTREATPPITTSPTTSTTGAPSPTTTDPLPTVNVTDLEVSISVMMFDEDKYNQAGNTDYLTSVNRRTGRTDIAAFAIEEIIKGPNQMERAEDGLRPTFGEGNHVWFASESNCNGADFKINIADSKATVQFCRDIMTAGDFSGFIVVDQITKTLNQFGTISKTRVLNKQGTCLDNMSGMQVDECWY